MSMSITVTIGITQSTRRKWNVREMAVPVCPVQASVFSVLVLSVNAPSQQLAAALLW